MTDFEKVRKLLMELDVGFHFPYDQSYIKCEDGYNNVSGYSGFYTLFEFDDNGKFESMGAWE